jgi:hypothetical protein
MTLRLTQNVWNSENTLYESLVSESIEIHGEDFFYVPRTFINKDEILGEDRLSQFKNAYPIVMYVETADGFEGQGNFMSKFGLTMDKQAILSVSKKNWSHMVGRHGTTIIPSRPAEGDLLYYPRLNYLFEIHFVESQQPFMQLGQQYIYKLTIEPFRYSSELMNTGNADIDKFNELTAAGDADVEFPQSWGDNNEFKEKASGFIFSEDNPFGDIT